MKFSITKEPRNACNKTSKKNLKKWKIQVIKLDKNLSTFVSFMKKIYSANLSSAFMKFIWFVVSMPDDVNVKWCQQLSRCVLVPLIFYGNPEYFLSGFLGACNATTTTCQPTKYFYHHPIHLPLQYTHRPTNVYIHLEKCLWKTGKGRIKRDFFLDFSQAFIKAFKV